ncbi:uncharacterized protein LOC133897425 [Phragmites australis]|uniref:uncharacterized protein LOC133897425 n=1 Tax=Phragmites australis TaxID=29695 RepID=UPI002D7787CD|nr:uncharacterized protein LOC133897425 [Phragmites australis]
MAPERRSPLHASSSSSDDEQVVEQHPTKIKNPPPPAPAHQESDTSDEEVESSDEVPPSQGKEGSDGDDEEEEDSESESDEALPESVRHPKVNVPPAKVAKLPLTKRKAAAAAELAESSPSKKKAPQPKVVESSQPNKATAVAELAKSPELKEKVAAPAKLTKSPEPKEHAAATELVKSLKAPAPAPVGADDDQGQVGQNAEKQMEEKSVLYGFLWREVLALEAEQPSMFKELFLKLTDDKARVLDTKIKKQRVAEVKLQLQWSAIEKVVNKVLIDIINRN